MIKKAVKKIISLTDFELKKKISVIDPIRLWETDSHFNKLYEVVRANTKVSQVRCFVLYQFFKHVETIGGDVAEVGVYRGGTAKLIALLNETSKVDKNIHLFDTFGGMPETSLEKDLHRKGDFSDTSLDDVQTFLKDCPKVLFYKGFFPDTAKPIEDKKFSFVHIDVDIYQSVLDCCDFFYPRMFPGGVIVFDDYGFVSCPGAKLAVDEFFKDKREVPIYLPSGQCCLIKL